MKRFKAKVCMAVALVAVAILVSSCGTGDPERNRVTSVRLYTAEARCLGEYIGVTDVCTDQDNYIEFTDRDGKRHTVDLLNFNVIIEEELENEKLWPY